MTLKAKKAVEKLSAYEPEPQSGGIILNANESPFNLPTPIINKIINEIKNINFNRYPDPFSKELINSFVSDLPITTDQVLAGSGLDEVISIISQTFLEPEDHVLSVSPTFSMYGIWAGINNANYSDLKLEDGYTAEKIIKEAKKNKSKIIYLCSPNNPTGHVIDKKNLKEILNNVEALVIIDEAYVDFAKENHLDLVNSFDNLIVLRTMSKAYSFPAGRCGFAISNKNIINQLKKVKSPYNLNQLTQLISKIILDNKGLFKPRIELIKKERNDLYKFLEKLSDVNVLKSEGNFLFLTSPRATEINNILLDNQILVRNYKNQNALRITVGTPEENQKLKEVLSENLK